MGKRPVVGGVIHTYQRYDPVRFPGPQQNTPDLAGAAMEHLLAYGDYRPLTAEELARAVRIDPQQIRGLGPSLDTLIALLEARKRKILATYSVDEVRNKARRRFAQVAKKLRLPKPHRQAYAKAVRLGRLRELERLWYRLDREKSPQAPHLLQVMQQLADHYLVEQLAANYTFQGNTELSVARALEIKDELERIDTLLKQLREARKDARIGLVDLEALAEFVEPQDIANLSSLQQQVQALIQEAARQQGLEAQGGQFHLTPAAYRVFQGKLLDHLFSDLQAARTGRHEGDILGEGSVELQATKPYEFGDSITQMDVPQTFVNALLRSGAQLPVRLDPRDIEIHRTRNRPKSATVVVMDLSGSMRYDGQYINVKRMGLALDGLIRSHYPGDFLRFIEMSSFARVVPAADVAYLMPKPVTINDPIVRLSADMSRPEVSEWDIPPHFTNIQHALQLARQLLSAQDTPNRQIVLITDGLPTAHFEQSTLYLLYPPDPATESATLREGKLCQREGIVINMFLVPSWSQSQEDIQFAQRIAASTSGRVFFTAGRDLDRYVLWDYVKRKREVIG